MAGPRVWLNDAELSVYNFDERTEERRGKTRRVWSFDLDAGGTGQANFIDGLLRSKELQLKIDDEQIRVGRGTYSYSFTDRVEGPRTRYYYSLEFFELFEGEEPEESVWGPIVGALADMILATVDRKIEAYEERLRAIEDRLAINNSEYVRRYQEKIDREVDEGWLKRWPDMARDLAEISKTDKVRQLLASLPPEKSESAGNEGQD